MRVSTVPQLGVFTRTARSLCVSEDDILKVVWRFYNESFGPTSLIFSRRAQLGYDQVILLEGFLLGREPVDTSP